MSDQTTFEYGATRTAAEIGALLRSTGTRLERGRSLTFENDETAVAVDPPAAADLEVEVDADRENGTTTVELELELEWTTTDDDPVRTGTADEAAPPVDRGPGDAGGEAQTGADDPGAAREATGDEPTDDREGTDAGTVDLGAIDDVDDLDVEGANADAGDPETDDPVGSMARFQVYRDRGDEWRWRLLHRNGNIIADGGEGYTRRRSAIKGLKSVARNAPGAEVERLD